MNKLKFAVFGTGFWANYQVPAWYELTGIELVAAYNRTRSKAEAVAQKFGIPRVYDSPEELLDKEQLDFVDIITDVDTHPVFTRLCAERGLNVICQKPMAPTLELAREMLDICKKHRVKLFIHENFRWQAPIRALKKAIDTGEIGRPFKARVMFCSAFPVFDNQPFLAELDRFILTDIGSHVLDICRFLFGEARSLYCLTQRVNSKIKGEDVANVLMEMESGLHCYAEMSYASILEEESFPHTLVLVEGEKGSIQLLHNGLLKITTRRGTLTKKVMIPSYLWYDPDYAAVHASIVDCNRDILNGLQGGPCETTGEDNFRTVQLVWAAYESAETGKKIKL